MTTNRNNNTETKVLAAILIIWAILVTVAFLWGWAL